MRIISGNHKGRKLNPGKLKSVRPTTDFAREGLFNILRTRIDFDNLDILDLFAGSGSVVLEFISRGAKSAVAVDGQADCVKFIAAMAEAWRIGNLRIVRSDVMRYLEGSPDKFDLIFADPPYNLDVFEKVWTTIRKNAVLRPSGLFIFEHHDKGDFSHFDGFQEKRTFGQVNFSIFSAV